MGFFERFKTRRASGRVEPDLSSSVAESVDGQASATETLKPQPNGITNA